MEQRLTLYRRHTAVCTQGYSTDDRIYDPNTAEGTSRADCKCPIVASGKLSNEKRRVLHRSTGEREWPEARRVRELWLAWKQTTEPAQPLRVTRSTNVTIDEAIQFFYDFQFSTNNQGDSTKDKYRVLLELRMKPWCRARGIRFVKEFDDAVTVKQFFMSWRNLQPVRGRNTVLDSEVRLAPNTVRAELERFRTFLRFCDSNGWIETNYAVRPHLKLVKIRIKRKVAPTIAEYGKVLKTLETWTDEYGRTYQPKARMLHAFVLCLRYTGQRISDVSMLNDESLIPDGDGYAIELTQIKTGSEVRIPIPTQLAAMLKNLPWRGEFEEPVTMVFNGREIRFGRKFWFWTGNSDVEVNFKSWSDDITEVLKRTEAQHGKFKHRTTPHSFRHFFAISMLSSGKVKIEEVTRWLGHGSIRVTEEHYGRANDDLNRQLRHAYTEAIAQIEGQGNRSALPTEAA